MTTFITSQPLDNISTTSSEFGERIPPKTGASDEHKGIDFSVPVNSKVYAAHSGKVIVKGYNPEGWGNFIILRDDSGAATLYAHLNSFSIIEDAKTGRTETIKVGSSINSGTQIALSGNTGSASSGPHFHFEIFSAEAGAKIGKVNIKNIKRDNPREHLAEAFPYSFAENVPADQFGIELTGDYRDNTLTGNKRSNIMKGLGGDDTYIFTTPFGSDQIIDSDFDGRIQINSVVLSGEAQPKTDKDGNEIEGQYSLNGYDLVRNGNDLVITKAGAITNLNRLSGDSLSDAISSTSNKITIQDFPFEQDKAFGISLGKTKDLYVDGNGELVSRSGYDLTQKALSDDNSRFFSGNVALIYKMDDQRGRFFGVQYLIDTNGYGNYYLSVFDAEGSEVSRQKIDSTNGMTVSNTNYPFSYADDSGKKFVLIPFAASNHYNVASGSEITTRIGICLVDQNTGEIINSIIIIEGQSDRANLQGNEYFLISESGGISFDDQNYYFHYIVNDLEKVSKGITNSAEWLAQQFSPTDLSKIGEPFICQSVYCYGSRGGVSSTTITLNNGNIIEYAFNAARPIFTIKTPALRDLNPDEIVRNYEVGSGLQQTNPDLKQCQLTIQEELETRLKMCLSPDSVTVINGLGSSNNPISRIDLSDFPEVDQNYLQSNTYSTTTSEYSIDDLLNGKFEASNSNSERRKLLESLEEEESKNDIEIDSLQAQSFTNFSSNSSIGNYTSDDYYEDSANVTSKNYLTEKEQELSVLLLPGNQTIVFTDVSKNNLTQSLGSYFTGVEGLPEFNVSESLTNSPTYSPTAIDSQASTKSPTFESTFIPSYIPTYTPAPSKAQLPTPSPTNFNSFNNTNSPAPIDWPENNQNNQNNYPFGLTKEQMVYGGAGAGGAVALAGVGVYLAKKWWNKGKEPGNKETNRIEELGNENNPEEKETRMENKKKSVEMIESKQEETNNPNSLIKDPNAQKLSGKGNSKANSLSNV